MLEVELLAGLNLQATVFSTPVPSKRLHYYLVGLTIAILGPPLLGMQLYCT
jgi:hypothetical protein